MTYNSHRFSDPHYKDKGPVKADSAAYKPFLPTAEKAVITYENMKKTLIEQFGRKPAATI
jgi:hypothetical protein